MNITVTLIFQMIAFILLIWFVNKYLWTPINTMLEERRKRIADGLAAAEKGKHEQELAEKHAKETLKEAKAQAAEVLAQAEKRASSIIEESKEKAQVEGERIKAAAQSEIDQEISRAKEQLRGQVTEIAIAGAAKVLGREIDSKSHDKLMKDLIEQI